MDVDQKFINKIIKKNAKAEGIKISNIIVCIL